MAAGGGRGRGDRGQQERAQLAQARPRARRRAAGGEPRRPAGVRVRGEPGEEGGDRDRRGGQGAGRGDGPLPAPGLRDGAAARRF